MFGSIVRRVVVSLCIIGILALIGGVRNALGAYVEACPEVDTVNADAVLQSCLAITERMEANTELLGDVGRLAGWAVGALLIVSCSVVLTRLLRSGS